MWISLITRASTKHYVSGAIKKDYCLACISGEIQGYWLTHTHTTGLMCYVSLCKHQHSEYGVQHVDSTLASLMV